MKGLTIFTSLVLIVCALCSFLPANDEMEIYENTIRLHVLANSDSEHDQRVKLAVRDAVLGEISAVTEGAQTVEEAEALVSASLGYIREIAKKALAELGESYAVNVTLSEEYYPTREYEDFRLPAGKYTSLRIMLGEAAGKNWWCVLYPSLCIGGAKTGETLVNTGFSKDQIDILTGGEEPKYRLKFKILEIFGQGLGE
ncbi:MAG: stage II sporulation protein R [Clostridia bacterium]|nr:stage II sporulation protein R [Clostridia bacterium]